MTAAKRKGTAFETALVAELHKHGWRHAERRALAGQHDRGDIAGIPRVVIEAKNCAKIDLAGWTTELIAEMRNDGAITGAVVAKRRGRSVSDAYAIMPLHVYLNLLKRADY